MTNTMADLLIFDKEHYMDSWTQEELEKRVEEDPLVKEKYDARYQKGDIVECREDGYWSGGNGRNFNKNAFCVVHVPNRQMEEYDRPLYDGDTLVRKRRYNIDVSNLVFTGKRASSAFGNLNITEKRLTAVRKGN